MNRERKTLRKKGRNERVNRADLSQVHLRFFNLPISESRVKEEEERVRVHASERKRK